MIKFFNVSYDELKQSHSDELYKLRKKTFSDRLGWAVVCNHDMEFDEFDNPATQYLLCTYHDQLICSVRFIALNHPNMITHAFSPYFDDIELPHSGIEASRFFVDKHRARQLLGAQYPISQALFLAMNIWGANYHYFGIHTIVSLAMLTILKRSGWQIKILKEVFLNECERIYLVLLPVNLTQQNQIASKLTTKLNRAMLEPSTLTWPLSLPI